MTLTLFSRSPQANFKNKIKYFSHSWYHGLLYDCLNLVWFFVTLSQFLRSQQPDLILQSLVSAILWGILYSFLLRNAQTPVCFYAFLVYLTLFSMSQETNVFWIFLRGYVKKEITDFSHLNPWFNWGMLRCQYVLMTLTTFPRSLEPFFSACSCFR